jgi:hypothetical protein
MIVAQVIEAVIKARLSFRPGWNAPLLSALSVAVTSDFYLMRLPAARPREGKSLRPVRR